MSRSFIAPVGLFGESGTGKTSIINRLVGNQDMTIPTKGTEFKVHKLNGITLKVWDTPGSERFRGLLVGTIRHAMVVIFVYSIDDRRSFNEIKNTWFTFYDETRVKELILFLVGNKNDLIENQQVTEEEGREYANQIGAKFFLTSSRSGEGINELFNEIANSFKKKSAKEGIKLVEHVHRKRFEFNICGVRNRIVEIDYWTKWDAWYGKNVDKA